MSFQIVTDSCSDFSPQMIRELNIAVVPLSVNFRNQVFADRNDESLKDLYSGFRKGERASTSAANPTTWADAFRTACRQGSDVLALAVSSGLSTTYQSAVIAADEISEEFPDRKILVVDTLSASLGQGLLVWYACQMREQGMNAEAVRDWVEANKLHLCHWFTVDDLMYLKHGGRISGTTALVGTMLSVKPVLHVDDDGHLVNVSKARGRKAAIGALARKFQDLTQGYKNDTVFISHGDCREEAEYLADILKTSYGVHNVYINYIGAVIGSHAGPGTIALFFMGERR